MTIQALDITNGIVLIIFCALNIYVGIRISLKYFEYKQRDLLLVGLVWIFLTCPWYPASISFILYLFTGNSLTNIPYFIIGNIFIPIAVMFWMITLKDFIFKERKKLIMIMSSVYGLIFYVIFFLLLCINPNLIGQLKGLTDVQYGTFIVVYALTILIIMIGTGFLFTRESLKSELLEIRLKGKLIFIAFILFAIGSGLDTSIPLNFVTLPIIRGFEIASAIVFYFGFFLPKWFKKFIKKEGSPKKE